MCWVMPPASPAATSVERIASSSEVLPWSTWPMIVTTGGRGSRSSSASSNSGSALASSAARDDLDLLVELVGEHLDRVVGQRLRERRHLAEAHQLLDDLRARATPRYSATSLTVEPELTRMTSAFSERDVLRDGLLVGAAPAPAAAPARRALRGTAAGAATGTAARAARTALAARGLRVDHDAAHAAGRAGSALALQRGARRPLALGPPPFSPPALGLGLAFGFGGVFGREVLRARGAGGAVAEAGALLDDRLRGGLLGRAVGGRLGLGLAGQRGVGELLVHGGRGGLHVESVRLQALEDLRKGHLVLLG